MKTNNRYLLFIALVSALGGFLFGYDWVVIGGAKPFYEQFFGISSLPAMQGWAMSSALVGCIVGVMIAGSLSDRLGRRPMLAVAALLFIASAVGTGYCDNFTPFIFYRILGGLGIGIASNLSPMYIAEISPAQSRGRFVSLNQLTIVLGILAAQITNLLISDSVTPGEDIAASWNGQMGWRVMFWAEAIPATAFLLLCFVIPESPRWLISKSRNEQGERVLAKIVGSEKAKAETAEIRKSLLSDKGGSRGVGTEILKRSNIALLAIGIVLAVFQQWCGINVIFNYAQEVFSAAGFGVSDVLFNIVITGVTNVLFTFVAIALVDRLGRRMLLIFGSAGLAVIYGALGGAFYMGLTGFVPVVLVMAAIAIYAMTLSAVMWVVISEIFPTRIRAAAMAISTFALWSACFLLTYTFPILNTELGTHGTFWLYGLICLLGLLFILRYVRETKGLSLEEIERKFKENQ
ncbi:sugar-proton symporter [Mucinivorans hirudinis]|uniref:Sugar-proton symporter n=1 Tax=Mucinivorans hirudinis TaxID=1433126 RepID=A0A060RB51_9BACT|nr:sugar-proton symporter [Mucinivorans hirudinis]